MHDLMFYSDPSRSAKHSHAVYDSFILNARGRSLAESHTRNSLIWTKESCYHCMKTVVFTENRNVWKHEDIKHTIATIYGLFVFFKSSPGNK